jgi:quinol monooxygenase YgiN
MACTKGGEMTAIRVIVEMKAQPGQRDQLRRSFETTLAQHAPNLLGFLGSARHEVVGDPDLLVEIAEWESAEARDAHMKEAAAAGTYAPLFAQLAAAPRVTVLRRLP